MATPEILTRRWYPLKAHPEQMRLIDSEARFRVVPAGRRSGKTERAKRHLVRKAFQPTPWDDPRYFAAAPTRDQAKAIYWADLKAMVPPWALAETPRESDLLIRLITGAEIQVIGMDKPQRIEGRSWNGGILDEYANMKEQAWRENVRPALSDRQGWCWLVGVPEGRNHYYDLYRAAQADETGTWAAFHWVSADILPPEEVESARRDLDELTFQQEYEASFVNFEGRAYYVFDERKHCARLAYDPKRTIAFCFDFNVEPGVAAVAQEQRLPNGLDGTGWIGEVWIDRNSNTPAVCRKLLTDWREHEGRIICYGDATGGARGTAKVDGSDWDIIKRLLRGGTDGLPGFGDRITFRVPAANPPERSRVNAVNTRFQNGAGDVHMMVDPSRAPHLVKDFEGVALLKGGSGEIDKKHDLKLTHISDAAGYYIVTEFPVTNNRTTVTEFRL